MGKAIVDLLEVVDIHKHQGGGTLALGGIAQQSRHDLLQVAAVVQAGQGILHGQPLQLARFFFQMTAGLAVCPHPHLPFHTFFAAVQSLFAKVHFLHFPEPLLGLCLEVFALGRVDLDQQQIRSGPQMLVFSPRRRLQQALGMGLGRHPILGGPCNFGPQPHLQQNHCRLAHALGHAGRNRVSPAASLIQIALPAQLKCMCQVQQRAGFAIGAEQGAHTPGLRGDLFGQRGNLRQPVERQKSAVVIPVQKTAVHFGIPLVVARQAGFSPQALGFKHPDRALQQLGRIVKTLAAGIGNPEVVAGHSLCKRMAGWAGLTELQGQHGGFQAIGAVAHQAQHIGQGGQGLGFASGVPVGLEHLGGTLRRLTGTAQVR